MGINEDMGLSAYLEVMGDTPINRVLDFFVTFDGVAYSAKHIANQTNLDLETTKKIMDKLVEEKFLKKNRLKYISNTKSSKFKKFARTYWEITNKEVRKFLAEEEKELVLTQ